MDVVTIHKAKTILSQLLVRVEAGEEIVLARGDKPIAKLVPYEKLDLKPTRQPGRFKGQIHLGPEFFEPMAEKELAEWE